MKRNNDAIEKKINLNELVFRCIGETELKLLASHRPIMPQAGNGRHSITGEDGVYFFTAREWNDAKMAAMVIADNCRCNSCRYVLIGLPSQLFRRNFSAPTHQYYWVDAETDHEIEELHAPIYGDWKFKMLTVVHYSNFMDSSFEDVVRTMVPADPESATPSDYMELIANIRLTLAGTIEANNNNQED